MAIPLIEVKVDNTYFVTRAEGGMDVGAYFGFQLKLSWGPTAYQITKDMKLSS
jgi:hypothetical protein